MHSVCLLSDFFIARKLQLQAAPASVRNKQTDQIFLKTEFYKQKIYEHVVSFAKLHD